MPWIWSRLSRSRPQESLTLERTLQKSVKKRALRDSVSRRTRLGRSLPPPVQCAHFCVMRILHFSDVVTALHRSSFRLLSLISDHVNAFTTSFQGRPVMNTGETILVVWDPNAIIISNRYSRKKRQKLITYATSYCTPKNLKSKENYIGAFGGSAIANNSILNNLKKNEVNTDSFKNKFSSTKAINDEISNNYFKAYNEYMNIKNTKETVINIPNINYMTINKNILNPSNHIDFNPSLYIDNNKQYILQKDINNDFVDEEEKESQNISFKISNKINQTGFTNSTLLKNQTNLNILSSFKNRKVNKDYLFVPNILEKNDIYLDNDSVTHLKFDNLNTNDTGTKIVISTNQVSNDISPLSIDNTEFISSLSKKTSSQDILFNKSSFIDNKFINLNSITSSKENNISYNNSVQKLDGIKTIKKESRLGLPSSRLEPFLSLGQRYEKESILEIPKLKRNKKLQVRVQVNLNDNRVTQDDLKDSKEENIFNKKYSQIINNKNKFKNNSNIFTSSMEKLCLNKKSIYTGTRYPETNNHKLQTINDEYISKRIRNLSLPSDLQYNLKYPYPKCIFDRIAFLPKVFSSSINNNRIYKTNSLEKYQSYKNRGKIIQQSMNENLSNLQYNVYNTSRDKNYSSLLNDSLRRNDYYSAGVYNYLSMNNVSNSVNKQLNEIFSQYQIYKNILLPKSEMVTDMTINQKLYTLKNQTSNKNCLHDKIDFISGLSISSDNSSNSNLPNIYRTGSHPCRPRKFVYNNLLNRSILDFDSDKNPKTNHNISYLKNSARKLFSLNIENSKSIDNITRKSLSSCEYKRSMSLPKDYKNIKSKNIKTTIMNDLFKKYTDIDPSKNYMSSFTSYILENDILSEPNSTNNQSLLENIINMNTESGSFHKCDRLNNNTSSTMDINIFDFNRINYNKPMIKKKLEDEANFSYRKFQRYQENSMSETLNISLPKNFSNKISNCNTKLIDRSSIHIEPLNFTKIYCNSSRPLSEQPLTKGDELRNIFMNNSTFTINRKSKENLIDSQNTLLNSEPPNSNIFNDLIQSVKSLYYSNLSLNEPSINKTNIHNVIESNITINEERNQIDPVTTKYIDEQSETESLSPLKHTTVLPKLNNKILENCFDSEYSYNPKTSRKRSYLSQFIHNRKAKDLISSMHLLKTTRSLYSQNDYNNLKYRFSLSAREVPKNSWIKKINLEKYKVTEKYRDYINIDKYNSRATNVRWKFNLRRKRDTYRDTIIQDINSRLSYSNDVSRSISPILYNISRHNSNSTCIAYKSSSSVSKYNSHIPTIYNHQNELTQLYNNLNNFSNHIDLNTIPTIDHTKVNIDKDNIPYVFASEPLPSFGERIISFLTNSTLNLSANNNDIFTRENKSGKILKANIMTDNDFLTTPISKTSSVQNTCPTEPKIKTISEETSSVKVVLDSSLISNSVSESKFNKNQLNIIDKKPDSADSYNISLDKSETPPSKLDIIKFHENKSNSSESRRYNRTNSVSPTLVYIGEKHMNEPFLQNLKLVTTETDITKKDIYSYDIHQTNKVSDLVTNHNISKSLSLVNSHEPHLALSNDVYRSASLVNQYPLNMDNKWTQSLENLNRVKYNRNDRYTFAHPRRVSAPAEFNPFQPKNESTPQKNELIEIWYDKPTESERESYSADMCLTSILLLAEFLHRPSTLGQYANDPRLVLSSSSAQRRNPLGMSFSLNHGDAVAAAETTENSIQYLAADIQLTHTVSKVATFYGARVMLTDKFLKQLSDNLAGVMFREVDAVHTGPTPVNSDPLYVWTTSGQLFDCYVRPKLDGGPRTAPSTGLALRQLLGRTARFSGGDTPPVHLFTAEPTALWVSVNYAHFTQHVGSKKKIPCLPKLRSPKINPKKLEFYELFREGYLHYLAGYWDIAQHHFDKANKLHISLWGSSDAATLALQQTMSTYGKRIWTGARPQANMID